jgi:hypothetical protein
MTVSPDGGRATVACRQPARRLRAQFPLRSQRAEDREHSAQVQRSTPTEVTFTIVYLLQGARTPGIYE